MLEGDELTSKWRNKTWHVIGDSITWQDQKVYAGTTEVAQGYQTLINETVKFKEIRNAGISGASMAKSSKYPSPNGSNCAAGVDPGVNYADVDLITLFAGTNDFKLNVPLGIQGQIGDTSFDDTTFYGAYRKLLEHILTAKPTIKIYLLASLQRDNSGYDVNFTNPAGCKLIDYVNAVKEIGQMYGLPVLDLYATSGITRLTLDTYTRDGLHPNDLGYARIADVTKGFLETY
jgi:lysophospholipase L1-like esterase